MALLIAALLAVSIPVGADAPRPKDEVKAAFLYNFTKFVEWPAPSLDGPKADFVIIVASDEGFAATLERLVAGETAKGRAVIVRRVENVQDIRRCQVLYISRAMRGRLAAVLRQTRGKPILTVAEIPGFAAAGGMINFQVREGRLGFEINKAAADRAGLSISSQLLGLATTVRTR